MLRSIATVSLSGTLPEKLEAAAAAGFDGVEIFENDLLYFDGSPRQVRQMAGDLGLGITMFQPFRDFEGAPRERMARNFERAERKFDLMAELGTSRMLVCSNAAPDTLSDPDLMAADLRGLAERAAQRGITICYEGLSWGRQVKDWRKAWSLIERAEHPNLGLVLDSFHVLALDDDLSGLEAVPAAKLSFVQIADAPRLSMDVLEWSRHFRMFPGQGEFDLASFLAPILSLGYDGPISLEIFNDGFRAAPPRPTAADGLRSLLYLEEIAGRAAKHSPHPVELFQPPPPADFRGFEFLEFAVDGESGAGLAACLRGLGFRRAGQHRSKDVELYRHGGINLILNAESDSFARSYFLMHGPSVCAAALATDNAVQALDRAKRYRCKPFAGGLGPNESVIPGICAPDGSLVYFVEQPSGTDIYRADFILDADEPRGGGYLSHIDHVSLGLPDGQFGTWLLFYKAALGFTADDAWVLPDPHGLVKSRVVRSNDGSVRIPLNISENRNTAMARSISTYGGAGVQHIAFATPDIIATVTALRDAGTRFLEIPRNYYDDLAAKFDLAVELLDRLTALDILYDRDAQGGEFFHCYTEAFEDRFVLEIVERRNYQLYGAVNAAVRLAALAAKHGRSPYSFNALEF